MTAAIVLELAIVLALIFVNGFFAMAEMALVAARKQRLRALAEAGNGRAKLCLKLLKQPERFLSAVQIGITLAGVLASAYGGATLAASLAQALRTVPALAAHAQTVALTAVVVPLTVLTLICGELVPKRLAMARPEALAMFAAPVMGGLMLASRPVIAFLGLATRACLHLLGLDGGTEPAVTRRTSGDCCAKAPAPASSNTPNATSSNVCCA
jgi:putative hemolysin